MPSVTRKAARSREERQREVRGRLLAAVETLLEEGGSFTEVSVEQLISSAGVARSTFYAHFPDKASLLRQLGEQVVDEVVERWELWPALPDLPTEAETRAAVRSLAEVHVRHRVVLAALAEAASYDDGVRELLDSLLVRQASTVEGHAAAALVRGGETPVGAHWIAVALTWMIDAGLREFVAPAGVAKRERLLGTLTQVVRRTLYGEQG